MNQNSIVDQIITKLMQQFEAKKSQIRQQLNRVVIDELSNPSLHNAITNQFINPLLEELSNTYEKFFVTMLVFVIATFCMTIIILLAIFMRKSSK